MARITIETDDGIALISRLTEALADARRELKEYAPPPKRHITGVRVAPRYKSHVEAGPLQQKVWELASQLQQAWVDHVCEGVELAISKQPGKYLAVVWDNAHAIPSGVATKYFVHFRHYKSDVGAMMEGRPDLRCGFTIIEDKPVIVDDWY